MGKDQYDGKCRSGALSPTGIRQEKEEIKLTFSDWMKKQLTAEEVEEQLNKRKTIGEKQKESDSRFAKREIARGTKW